MQMITEIPQPRPIWAWGLTVMAPPGLGYLIRSLYKSLK